MHLQYFIEFDFRFVKRYPNGGSVTFTNSIDPVKVEKDETIPVSDKFKQKVINENSEVLMKFSTENIRYEKQHRFQDPDDITTSNYKRLKARFNNILHLPSEYSKYRRQVPLDTNLKKENRKRLDHMLKVFLTSGFPDENQEQNMHSQSVQQLPKDGKAILV